MPIQTAAPFVIDRGLGLVQSLSEHSAVDVHSYWLHRDGQRGEEQRWSIGGMWETLWPLLVRDPSLGLSTEDPAVASISLYEKNGRAKSFLPAVSSVSDFSFWDGSAATEALCRSVNRQQERRCSLFFECSGISLASTSSSARCAHLQNLKFSSEILHNIFEPNNSEMNNEQIQRKNRLWQT